VSTVELKVWRPLFDIEREIRSMFERPTWMMTEAPIFPIRPRTDLVHEDGHLAVTAELPGIDPEKDVSITVEDDVLIIKGEKTKEKEFEEKDRFIHERHFGTFERRIPLPDGVDPDAIEASYDKGVLKIVVPLPEEKVQEPRKIDVTIT
jgi:HSP20 family protein